MTRPARGEFWLVDFDPSVGAEIAKRRPALVVSVSSVGRLPLCIVVPVTAWDPLHARHPWLTRIDAIPQSGLSKTSTADAFQVKSVSLDRLVRRLGSATPGQLEEVVASIGVCIGIKLPPTP